MYPIKTEQELRNAFWKAHPQFSRRKKIKNFAGTGTMYPTDVRVAWSDFVDTMSKDSQVSQELAQGTGLNT